MIKPYNSRKCVEGDVNNDVTMHVVHELPDVEADGSDFEVTVQPIRLGNSMVFENLAQKLDHLGQSEKDELSNLINEYRDIFPDVPGKAKGMKHDVDVGEAIPIKQHPYRVGPEKRKIIDKEIKYMLENKIIETTDERPSEWSSPCLLTPKPDGSFRFCTDFRKVNRVTKADCYPLPRIDSLIDDVGDATYVSKLDLLKGYWQVELTERAKDISAFCTYNGLYRYLVCPFGMKNSGCTFQRLMNMVVSKLKNTRVYVDDLIVFTSTWQEHVIAIRALFKTLREYNLTVNLVKTEFAKATVQYLGHEVGQGKVLPIFAKIQAILNFPAPHDRKAVMRLIGMCGFYRKFCPNLSTVIAPLTDLVSTKRRFTWTEECQEALIKVKRILTSPPVLVTPDYTKEFELYCDSSDVAVGASLMQCDDDGVKHPISYYSKKLDKHQRNYSTVEKEALSLLLAIKHYDVYLSSSSFPIQIHTDHNPLTFIHKMKTDNRRLLCWSLTLQEYNLEIHHVKGSENVIADALSRI